MRYNDNMVVGRVPRVVRERTRKYMDEYNMDLYDAFNEAVRNTVKNRNTRLWKAWYKQDLRKYIPDAYNAEYLDFKKYPIEY